MYVYICNILLVLQLQEGGHLAPSGVPSSHMPRALSGQNINEEQGQMLGADVSQGNNETNNPFLQPYETPQRLWTATKT